MPDSIKIGDRLIGDNHRPYVIAEAAVSHQGEVETARVWSTLLMPWAVMRSNFRCTFWITKCYEMYQPLTILINHCMRLFETRS